MGKFILEFECQSNHEYQQLLDAQRQRNLSPSEFLLCQNLLNFVNEAKILSQKVN